MFVSVYFLPDIFCELCFIGKVCILCKTRGNGSGFFFHPLEGICFFVQATLNLCNKIARCQILRKKGLCLNLVTKVRVELIFYCNEVLVKNFCSNLLWAIAPFYFNTFQYFKNAAEFGKACITAWEVSSKCVFSDPYFSALGLNTKIYSVSLCIRSEYGKIWTRILILFTQCIGKLPSN